LHYAIWKRNGW